MFVCSGCVSAALLSEETEQAARLLGAGGKLSHRARATAAGGGVFGRDGLRIGVQQAAQPKIEQPNLFEQVEAQWVEVDLKRVRVECARQFGGVWLGYEFGPGAMVRSLERTALSRARL